VKWFTKVFDDRAILCGSTLGVDRCQRRSTENPRITAPLDRDHWGFRHSSDRRNRRGGCANLGSARGDPYFEYCRGGVWHYPGPGALAITTFGNRGSQSENDQIAGMNVAVARADSSTRPRLSKGSAWPSHSRRA